MLKYTLKRYITLILKKCFTKYFLPKLTILPNIFFLPLIFLQTNSLFLTLTNLIDLTTSCFLESLLLSKMSPERRVSKFSQVDPSPAKIKSIFLHYKNRRVPEIIRDVTTNKYGE